jgi:hypothetical protein
VCNSAVKLGRNLGGGGGEKGKGAGCVPVCSRLAGTGEYRNYGGIMDGACCLVS